MNQQTFMQRCCSEWQRLNPRYVKDNDDARTVFIAASREHSGVISLRSVSCGGWSAAAGVSAKRTVRCEAPVYPSSRQTLRLKPGGFINFPPRFLKHAGWRVGDALLLSVEGGRISVTRLPDERTWRIDRSRRRTGTRTDGDAAAQSIRTLGDYLALSRYGFRRSHGTEQLLTFQGKTTSRIEIHDASRSVWAWRWRYSWPRCGCPGGCRPRSRIA